RNNSSKQPHRRRAHRRSGVRRLPDFICHKHDERNGGSPKETH
ncbi:hypothetical protein CDAR_194021, partial [Caerostris darwini]